MPICPQCSLGLPPTLTKCPDCGRRVVEIATVVDLGEPEIDFISTEEEVDHWSASGPVQEPVLAIEVLPPEDDPIPVIREPASVIEDPEVEHEPEPVEEHDLKEEIEGADEDSSEFDEEPEPAEEEEEPEEDEFGAEEEPADAGTGEPGEPVSVVEEATSDDAGADQPEEAEDDLDQFLAGDKRFTRVVHEPTEAVPPSPQTMDRQKPVRWAHRAYRGDIDVISQRTSRGMTLAVFGDGLLLIDGGRAPAISSLVPALGGRRRKAFSNAGSSAEAAARINGSRHLPKSEIHSVRIAKGRTWARELTVRTTEGEELHYRFSSKRHGLAVSLLSPVFGPKLRDATKEEKAPKRAG